MEIKKGKIENINKRLLAGTLVFILSTTPLVGCENEALRGFEYEIQSGQTVCINTVAYSYLQGCKVVFFEFDGAKNICICRVGEYGNYGKIYKSYFNIFGEQLIYKTSEETPMVIEKEVELTDYLVAYDKVQLEYTEEEIKEILQQIKLDNGIENNRQKVKG